MSHLFTVVSAEQQEIVAGGKFNTRIEKFTVKNGAQVGQIGSNYGLFNFVNNGSIIINL